MNHYKVKEKEFEGRIQYFPQVHDENITWRPLLIDGTYKIYDTQEECASAISNYHNTISHKSDYHISEGDNTSKRLGFWAIILLIVIFEIITAINAHIHDDLGLAQDITAQIEEALEQTIYQTVDHG